MRTLSRRAHRLGTLMTIVALALAVFTMLSLTAGASTRRGQDAGSVTTTTTPVELLPPTVVTSDRTPPSTAPEVEVKGEQAFADRDGASWAWWLLLLLLLPVVGFGFGVVRQRLSSHR